jgi:type I restriction enzyme S subunit
MFKPSGYAVYEQQHAIHGHTKIRYFIDDRKYKEMERFSVEAGDLIMSCSGVTLGRVNLLPSNTPVGIINQALLKMRVKPIMNVLFFKYWLESTHFQEIIMKYSGGAAIPNVPAVKIIKEINISIPSSAEQQRIVSRLDSLSAHVRELEEVLQKTIAECDALKQALLRKVFE